MGSILIGLHGVKRSGKDTTIDFLEEFVAESELGLSAVRRGFADKAKWAFMRQFIPDITMADALAIVDRFKEDPDALISFPGVSIADGSLMQFNITFRNALAQFATEGARDIYGDDHWVDQLLHPNGVWEGEFDYADICTIRDLRFENERQRIHQFGGINIKIRRKDAEDAVIEEAARQGREVHRSELGIADEKFDYVINNDDNDLLLAKQRTREVWENIYDNRF